MSSSSSPKHLYGPGTNGILARVRTENLSNKDFDARLQDSSASFVRQHCPGSTAVMIAFGGIKLGLGMPTFEFFQLARDIAAHKLFFRDVHQAWYHRGLPGVGARIDAIAAFIRSEITGIGATRIAVFGNSMGGYAALLFGALIKAHEVHAFAPQTFLSPWSMIRNGDFRWKRDIWRVYFSADRSAYLGLREALRIAKETEFHIHFSAANRLDTVHARELDGIANVHLHDHPEGGHRVVKALRDNGTLQQIIRRALVETGPVNTQAR
jgi:pimeloyl-ACP methyl ester carboxylesterase